jgi:hypothetical protein
MDIQPITYHSFLVRVWHETPDATWLAMAQSVQTGKIVRFSSLEGLCQFLKSQTQHMPEERPLTSECRA